MREQEARISTTPVIRKIDKETRVIEFIASDASRDSHHTVIPVSAWALDRFNANGVIGYQHNLHWSSDPDDVIGKGYAFIEKEQLVVRIEFEPAEINELAEKIFKKIAFGSIKAVSVGFREITPGHYGEDGAKENRGQENETYYFSQVELMEVSVVNIPSNKNALKRALENLIDDAAESGESMHTNSDVDNLNEESIIAKAVLATNNIVL